ncbi:CueP family metal-binding protein [Thermus caldifontis]|uniref:CueP family metal-binding protein n=1 Tax=Thermus caldifontis TaxID=1930763 RepID=UPI000DF302F6|nr:CueP family metal-binding protein [Thermus caldifontis]
MKKLLALALGVALGVAQAPSPEALKGLGPEEALALAKRWREEGQKVVSYVTPEAFFFEFPDGRKAQVALRDRFLLAVAPYVSRTHPCQVHYFSSCTGELQEEVFEVRVLEGEKEVLKTQLKTGRDGFFELWLPRNRRYTLEIRRGNLVATGFVTTFSQSPTCLTGFRLTSR